jgi:hypothetical protein
MATTKLVIRKDKVNTRGECVIFVLYTHNQKSIKISTGEKIPPEFWDEVGCRVKKSYKGFTSLNAAIDKKESEVKELANLAKSLGVDPTVDYIGRRSIRRSPALLNFRQTSILSLPAGLRAAPARRLLAPWPCMRTACVF